MENNQYIKTLNSLLIEKKIEGSSIRSIEIQEVNDLGLAKVKFTKKAGKVMANMIADIYLLLDHPDVVESYEHQALNDMTLLFTIRLF